MDVHPIAEDLGFSVVEVLVATSLLLLLVSALFGHFNPADGAFATQTEGADMQQRLRAALDAVRRDVSLAGSGAAVRPDDGSIVRLAPAVVPRRIGLRAGEAPEVVRRDAFTVVQGMPLPAVSTTLAQVMPAGTDVTRVTVGPGCPPADPVCGLALDADVLIADADGAFDLFTVVDVTPPMVMLRHNGVDWGKLYPVGSPLIPVAVRTYYLRDGSGSRPSQLVRYDGGSGPDVPVVDHVVRLSVEYLGDPDPPRMRRPLSEQPGPWTTYGPRPPAADTTVTPYLAGTNCVFEANGTPLAAARLPSLGADGSALVPLTIAQLTDGPWCPDGVSPNRYDADLLRVRSVVITIRVESALDALRGPAGLLFARGGTARAADRYAPDLEVRTRMTPVNLMAGR